MENTIEVKLALYDVETFVGGGELTESETSEWVEKYKSAIQKELGDKYDVIISRYVTDDQVDGLPMRYADEDVRQEIEAAMDVVGNNLWD